MPGFGVNANKSGSERWVEYVLLDGTLVDIGFKHLNFAVLLVRCPTFSSLTVRNNKLGDPLSGVLPTLCFNLHNPVRFLKIKLQPLTAVVAARGPTSSVAAVASDVEPGAIRSVISVPLAGSLNVTVWYLPS